MFYCLVLDTVAYDLPFVTTTVVRLWHQEYMGLNLKFETLF